MTPEIPKWVFENFPHPSTPPSQSGNCICLAVMQLFGQGLEVTDDSKERRSGDI